MPQWAAEVIPWIDDMPSAEAWPGLMRRLGLLIDRATPALWSRRLQAKWCRIVVVEAMQHTTDAAVVEMCEHIIVLLDCAIAGNEPSTDEWAAARAAAEAAWAAAEAGAAARAAAKAAEAAAKAAAWAAAEAAAKAAAWATAEAAWAAWAAAEAGAAAWAAAEAGAAAWAAAEAEAEMAADRIAAAMLDALEEEIALASLAQDARP
jgi:hypothetical protein